MPASVQATRLGIPNPSSGYAMQSENSSTRRVETHGLGVTVQARVALALLQAVRDNDRPGEVLNDEDLAATLPRRLGLSEVVDSQIRRYEQDARRRRRVPGAEVRDLIRLVTRRPDSEDLFHSVGRSLGVSGGGAGVLRVVPRVAGFALGRRAIVKRLRTLFGQAFVASVRAPFELEAKNNVIIEGDPGGEACALVTGISQAILDRSVRPGVVVEHPLCRARGHHRCVWQAREGSAPAASGAVTTSSTENGHVDRRR